MNTNRMFAAALICCFLFSSSNAGEIKRESEINKPFSYVVLKVIQSKEIIQQSIDSEVIEEKDKLFGLSIDKNGLSFVHQSRIKVEYRGEELWFKIVTIMIPKDSLVITSKMESESDDIKSYKMILKFEKLDKNTKATMIMDVKIHHESGFRRVIANTLTKSKLEKLEIALRDHLGDPLESTSK